MKRIIALLLVLLLVSVLTGCNGSAAGETAVNGGTQNSVNPSDTAVALEKATQSAVLQEARNLYTEAYAEDISDGVVDGKKGNTAIADTNYTVNDGIATYSYTDRGYTVVFDGTAWSLSEK